ncbi:hypothetical protein F4778DRAFT_789894 [Xylariomycetidae sp. FL2044]|nr:hypothetical protein F4778DRAFT_789894 [Xylariomycetidae sp. FL2044]
MHFPVLLLFPPLLAALVAATTATTTTTTTTPNASLLEPLLITPLVANIGNAPPPSIAWTPDPSPACAAVNGGELQCCQGTLAGDLPLVVFLAELYGYELNPNDVNGISCQHSGAVACPGVTLCCQVTALNPLLSLYCVDP